MNSVGANGTVMLLYGLSFSQENAFGTLRLDHPRTRRVT